MFTAPAHGKDIAPKTNGLTVQVVVGRFPPRPRQWRPGCVRSAMSSYYCGMYMGFTALLEVVIDGTYYSWCKCRLLYQADVK